MEEQEECFPAPGGGTVCRVVTREVCDDDIHYFAFGTEATVHDDQWLYLLREDADPVIFGKAFETFPYRNVVLWYGAKLVWTEGFQGLELDLEKLGQSLREALFGALYLESP